MQATATTLNEETLQRQIGEANLAFQYLENELLEIEWFCTQAESLKPRRRFVEIVKDVRRTVSAFLDRTGVPPHAALRGRFAAALTSVLEAARQRNRTVHSVYRWHDTFQDTPSLTRAFTERRENGATHHKFEPVTAQTIAATSEFIDKAFEELFALHHVLMYELPHPSAQ